MAIQEGITINKQNCIGYKPDCSKLNYYKISQGGGLEGQLTCM